jgi:hypothetical protein
MFALFHAAPSFNRRHWLAASARSTDRSSRPIGRPLRTIWMGLLEGLIAHHRYAEMMRQGIPPDRALRLALAISHAGHGVCAQGSAREGEDGHV